MLSSVQQNAARTRRKFCHGRFKHWIAWRGLIMISRLAIFRMILFASRTSRLSTVPLPSSLPSGTPKHFDLVNEFHDMDVFSAKLLKNACHCLDQSSLRTFPEVSSTRRAAAIDTLFRHVGLRCSLSQTLLPNIERFIGVLKRLNAFKHVSKISVLSSNLHPLEGPQIPDCGDSWLCWICER